MHKNVDFYVSHAIVAPSAVTQPKEQTVKRYKQWSFRPTPDNEKRLELAGSIGLNVSELLNEAVEETFDSLLKKKSKQIQSVLEKVPA
jgi:hypothetical protein